MASKFAIFVFYNILQYLTIKFQSSGLLISLQNFWNSEFCFASREIHFFFELKNIITLIIIQQIFLKRVMDYNEILCSWRKNSGIVPLLNAKMWTCGMISETLKFMINVGNDSS